MNTKLRKTINPDSKLKLVGIRLSGDETTKVVDDKSGVNGKLNETSDNRLFYIADFQDPENPFATTRSRIISQQFDSTGNAVWKGGSPSFIKNFIGKLIPGEIVTLDVPEFQIGERMVTTSTQVVLKGENILTIFRQSGHDLEDIESEIEDVELEEDTEDESVEDVSMIEDSII